jgi:hypothetical protein
MPTGRLTMRRLRHLQAPDKPDRQVEPTYWGQGRVAWQNGLPFAFGTTSFAESSPADMGCHATDRVRADR